MVERKVCTFCGGEIEPGTGRMYIKKDGAVFQFCTSKCFKNMVELGRVPRRTTWTRHYEREKSVRVKGAPEEPKKARKVKAPVAEEKDEGAPESEEKESEEEAEKAESEEAPKKKRAEKRKREAKEPEGDDE